mmetsp:Transcript_4996/g.11801  ORF Transcript_4996/g.11801 Transcript_4996/m.11801 type:complete len:363 (-) Transcript_4996:246-1334(-)
MNSRIVIALFLIVFKLQSDVADCNNQLNIRNHRNHRKGRKCIVQRKNCQEISTQEDDFCCIKPVVFESDFSEIRKTGSISLFQGKETVPRPFWQAAEGVLQEDLPFLPGPRETQLAAPCAKIRGGEDIELKDNLSASKTDEMSTSQNHQARQATNAPQKKATKVNKAVSISQKLSPVGYWWEPKCQKWHMVELKTGSDLQPNAPAIFLRLMRTDDVDKMQPIISACKWTANFPLNYYINYMQHWPNLCISAESQGKLCGYTLAKLDRGMEGTFGHISAVTIKQEYRGRNLGRRLMAQMEMEFAKEKEAKYVDLFVKETNTNAIGFYEHLGYTVHRRIPFYYDDCDALEMRKTLALAHQTSMR